MPRPQLSPQTPRTISNDPVAFTLAPTRSENECQLYAGGNGVALSKSDRTAMLAKLRAGAADAPSELELEAVTFIQRDTPNRNYVRFKPGMLASFGKSFEGQPVLKDHDSRSLSSRAGTIIASKLEHNDDGSKQIRMRLKLVKDWAIEAALDGTLDRFSIGWNRTAPTQCSICEASLRNCDHWPGETDAKSGRVCELLFTGADGTEVSGVNVPAIVGTRIESISQLEAIDPAQLACILGDDATGSVPADPKEKPTMNNLPALVAALGLPPTATEDQILAAAEAAADKLKIAEQAKTNTETRLAAIEVENKKRADADRASLIEAGISKLVATGKIKPGSEVETALRRQGARDMELFAASVADMAGSASVTPVGAPTPGATKDPAGDGPLSDGKAFAKSNPEIGNWLKKAGISEEEFEKYGAKARETAEQLRANMGR